MLPLTGARTGGTVWRGRRRRWRWEQRTGRCPGGWPACARHGPRPPPGPGSRRRATPTRRRPLSPGGSGARPTACARARRGTPEAARATSRRTPRPSPTAASVATPTPGQGRATCRRAASGCPSASARTAAPSHGRGQGTCVPLHDDVPGTRDARERRDRPAPRGWWRGRQGHGQAQPRARDALAPRLDRPAGRRGDSPRGRDARGPRPRRAPRDPERQVPEGRPRGSCPATCRRAPLRRRGATWPPFRAASSSCPPPRHGSWPDLVEGFFSKMTRQMLRGIWVPGKDESGERILRYLEEADADPVVYRWR